MVHAGGRPREHNREQIAIDIVEWARLPDSINLNKFCAHYEPPIPPPQLSIWGKQDPEFRKAVDTAKGFIAYRREEKLNNDELHVKGYDINATVYDALIREDRREQAQFEADLKKEQDKVVSEDIKGHFDATMQQLKKMQDDHSRSLNSAERTSNTESKS